MLWHTCTMCQRKTLLCIIQSVRSVSQGSECKGTIFQLLQMGEGEEDCRRSHLSFVLQIKCHQSNALQTPFSSWVQQPLSYLLAPKYYFSTKQIYKDAYCIQYLICNRGESQKERQEDFLHHSWMDTLGNELKAQKVDSL